MTAAAKGITINVAGRELRVAAPDGEEKQLLASVDLLNRKMKEIKDSGKVVGTERIAIMAALNIAHDLLAQDSGAPAIAQTAAPHAANSAFDESIVKRRMQEFENIIDKALSDQDKLF
jgi:cell division protein ZapA